MGYNNPGRQDRTGPYGGRGRGTGRRLGGCYDSVSTGDTIDGRVRGPDNTPDGRGSKGAGRGFGLGGGREDGSGLEAIARSKGWQIGSGVEYVISTKNYRAVQDEYSSISSQYGDFQETKGAIAQAHNEAVRRGYKGKKRREYVEEKVSGRKKKSSKSTESKED